MTPAATRRSATSWAPAAGVAMMPMAIPSSATRSGRSSTWRISVLAQQGADLGVVGVDEGGDGEAPLAEPAVVGQGGTQVADADDDDRPVLGEAQLPAHLEQQVLDVVADAPGAVGPEIGEVLAHLGGVDPGQLGQALRRDRGGLLGVHLDEGAEVDGQPGHRGLGYASAGPVHTHTLPTTFLCSQSRARARFWTPRQRRPTLSAMSLHTALAASATLVSLAFAFSTLERWLARRRRHEGAWTISLFIFAAGSAALWVGAAVGWSEWSFKAFYLFGAILNVPFLALGTVELLAGPTHGRRWTAIVSLLAAFCTGLVVSAPLVALHRPRRAAPGQGGLRCRPAHRRRAGLRGRGHRDLRRRGVERLATRAGSTAARRAERRSRPAAWPWPTCSSRSAPSCSAPAAS